MKPRLLCLASICLLGLCAVGLHAQAPKIDYPQASPASTLKQRVGLTDIEIVYSRPGLKGRSAFGEHTPLAPVGDVWRTGANEATRITFSTAVKFGGADVPAGSYGLFTIPGATEWTVILNKVPNQWGAYKYDSKNDLVRVTAAPVHLADAVETFTIDVNDIRDEAATLELVWGNVKVPVKLAVDVVGLVGPQIEASMKALAGSYDRAAMFYLEHGMDLAKATDWIDAALKQQPNSFYLVYHKAQILAKQGDKAGALAAARRSLELVAKQDAPIKDEYTGLNQKLIDSLGQ